MGTTQLLLNACLRQAHAIPEPESQAFYEGLMDYCRIYTSGTLGGAQKLISREGDIAINWWSPTPPSVHIFVTSHICLALLFREEC